MHPFDVTFGLAAFSEGTFFGTSSSFANFADTLTITGIQVNDANGSPVTGWTVLAGSGAQVGPNGIVPASGAAATPEPGSFLLVGSCSLAVGLFRMRVLDTAAD